MKGFLESRSCICGKSKFQMTGFTDIKFPGVFSGEFQRKLDSMTYIGDIISSKDDIVSVAAPALGISGKFNGENLCICGLYGIVNGSDLSGCSGTGTEKPKCINVIYLREFLTK